jgi:uncharacterized protein YjbI with pentapeptide repeats
VSGGPQQLAAEIRAGRRDGLDDADLRGADLRRIELGFVGLRRARLDEADLSEAILQCVDLSQASLRGARLHRTHLDHVKAPRASFAGATFDRAIVEGCDLSHADLSDARLEHTFFRNSNLERARLDRARLGHGKLAHTNCTGASFRDGDLDSVLTVGSTFFLAEVETARRFFLCRDLVAEILLREVGDDFERARLVGAVATNPTWCFREWKAWLDFHPAIRDQALAVFARYPHSGCREALLEGYAGPAEGSGFAQPR